MNKARGLHTLCLLDIDTEENKLMSVKEALEILLRLEEVRKDKIISTNDKIIVFSRAGSKEMKIFFKCIKDLMEFEIKLPAVLIVPGSLHFTEKEFLETMISSSLHD